MQNILFIGADHAGVRLKAHLLESLRRKGLDYEDCGTFSDEVTDWPSYALAVCGQVLAKGGSGILVCGSGIGMCIAANRLPGIRAVLCTNTYQAEFARAHNNANVLCLGERVTGPGLALHILDMFLVTPFARGIHSERLALMEQLVARRGG